MTTVDIAHGRLINQGIVPGHLTTPSAVVAWLGAMQGQDYAGAKWAVGLRLPGSTDVTIEAAFHAKTIIRTWALRGTLHLVAATDLRWLLALLAPRLIAGNARRYRELQLDEATFMHSNDLLAAALQDSQPLDRPALLAHLEQAGIATIGQRGVYMLQRASLDGLICQGVAVRNVPTFMALDESIAQGNTLTREEALAELALRYFTSHGPATLKDFIRWSGLTADDARAGLAASNAQLQQLTMHEQTYWLAQEPPISNQPPQPLYLLPGFDEYLLGYADRSAVLDPQYANHIVPGGNGIFYPTIVSKGQIVGTWQRTFKKGAVVITAQPFTTLQSDEQEAFAHAAERFGAYLEMPATVA